MPSKTHLQRVAQGRRRKAADMRARGLDPRSSADQTEHTRQICDRILVVTRLRARGFEEVGGGDDFEDYGRGSVHVLVKDDGSWEHHDFSVQTSDDPSQARAIGRGPNGLPE